MLRLSDHLFFVDAGVHDSFWTHACDVDVMNRIIREEFVKLHEKPILENVQCLDILFYFVFYVNI